MQLNDKSKIIEIILEHWEHEWQTLVDSALDAKNYATDDESRAENKYDTRGLEASYLAHGQAQRAEDIKQCISVLSRLPVRDFKSDKIEATALVQLRNEDTDQLLWFFMIPDRGGLKLNYNGTEVTTVSPGSPIGKKLFHRRLDDEFDWTMKGETQSYTIVQLI